MLKNILIVDDSAALHQIYNITVKRYKCNVISALSGQEGLNKLAQNPDVDLMLVDMNMPHMSGLEFIKKVKEMATYSNIPIIIITTKGKEEGVREAVELSGGNLVKPFTSNELHERIEKLFPQFAALHARTLVYA